jgi:hypothetical protein
MKKLTLKNVAHLLAIAFMYSGFASADTGAVKQENLDIVSVTAHAGDKCAKTGSAGLTIDRHLFYCASTGIWQDQEKAAWVSVDVLIKNGDKVVHESQITTLDGHPAPVTQVKESAYLKSIEPVKDGFSVTPGILKTFLTMEITPEIQLDKRVKTDVSLSIVDADPANNLEMHQAFMLNMFKPGEPITKQLGVYTIQISANPSVI